jgi:hypothetical protein
MGHLFADRPVRQFQENGSMTDIWSAWRRKLAPAGEILPAQRRQTVERFLIERHCWLLAPRPHAGRLV